MSRIPTEKLDRLVERWESIQLELNQGPGQATYARLTKEFSNLDPIVATYRELNRAAGEIADIEALCDDPATDKDMAVMAQEERERLRERHEELADRLRIQLLPKDAADDGNAILEIRAGTGGDEAALFAADLFRMYARYAALRGWRTEIISLSENDLGGD